MSASIYFILKIYQNTLREGENDDKDDDEDNDDNYYVDAGNAELNFQRFKRKVFALTPK